MERKVMEESFGPPPKEYNYRCSSMWNRAFGQRGNGDAGIGMAKNLTKNIMKGICQKVGCPGVITTMECVEQKVRRRR